MHPFYRQERAEYVSALLREKKKPQTLLRPLADNLYPFFSGFRFADAAYVKQPLDQDFLASNTVENHTRPDVTGSSILSFSSSGEPVDFSTKASEDTTQPGNLVSMVGFFSYYSKQLKGNSSATLNSIFETDDYVSKYPDRSGPDATAG